MNNEWIIPASRFGKISVLSIVAGIVLFFLSQTIRIVPRTIPQSPSFFNDPLHAVLLILTWVAGTAALVLGVYYVIKRKERSVVVFVSILAGFFVFAFGAGEVIAPH
jgi:nitrate reductase gamma subunit